MDLDLDTFLTTVYVAIAAWCATEPPASPYPGHTRNSAMPKC